MTMTTAEERDQDAQVSPAQVRRGRRTALLLFAIGFGPMVLATIMFYTGWLNPTGHSNKGVLIEAPVPLTQLHFNGADGNALADRFGPQNADAQWMMIVVADRCAGACEELLYTTRQVNIALGKNANRVNRAAWLGSMSDSLSSNWATEYPSMEKLSVQNGETPTWPVGVSPGSQPRVLLVDPFGNVIMHYGQEHTGKDMLKDLKHLLKLSQIG